MQIKGHCHVCLMRYYTNELFVVQFEEKLTKTKPVKMSVCNIYCMQASSKSVVGKCTSDHCSVTSELVNCHLMIALCTVSTL